MDCPQNLYVPIPSPNLNSAKILNLIYNFWIKITNSEYDPYNYTKSETQKIALAMLLEIIKVKLITTGRSVLIKTSLTTISVLKYYCHRLY